MIKKKKLKLKRRFSTIFLLFITLSSIFTIFPMNSVNLEKENHDDGKDIKDEVKIPSLSNPGETKWWNSSFNYRQPLNITNPYNEEFTDFLTKVTFNYTQLVVDGKLNQSLKDIRIVENGTLKKYYIEIDYPQKDFATVWFDTDILSGPDHSEIDTYMYYGYINASFASNYLMDNHPEGLFWYKFEEGSGNIAIDSLNNFNATLKGDVPTSGWTSDSAVGNFALELDGNGDYLAIQDKFYAGPNQIPELTVVLWFKTGYDGGDYTQNWAFLDFDRSEYFNFYITPDSSNNGKLGFSSYAKEAGNTESRSDFYGTADLNDNTWHFAAARYDGTNKYLYRDNGTQDNVEYNPHNGFAIGDRLGDTTNDNPRYGFIGDGSEATTFDGSRNNRYYIGLIDEIRYFEYDILAPDRHPNRMEWLAKNYNLIIERKDEESKEATVRVYVKDVDGRVVSGAEVFLFNESKSVNYTETTGVRGYADFLSIEPNYYNITVNYTIYNGADYFEEDVFNSSTLHTYYRFDDVQLYETYIEVNLWSIDFEIEDWDLDPMGYGYVLVYNSSDYTELIANLTLNKEFGTTSFRWYNRSIYSYKVFYNNADYDQPQTLLSNNTVNRTIYVNSKLKDKGIINVNNTNIEIIPGQFHVQERVYATGSNTTHIGNTKIINATIALNKMNYSLTSVEVYSIDINNNISINPIYNRPPPAYSSPFQRSDTIEINVTEYANAYGLLIDVKGTNSSIICNGTIDVNYTESSNQYVRVNMSKLEIKVFDVTGEWDPTYGNVFVVITNATNGANITTLLTNDQGIAKGQINTDLGFWYINHNASNSHRYNFTLFYAGDNRYFNATSDPSNYNLTGFNYWYNYTLYGKGTIEFRMQISMGDYKTEFQNEIGEGLSYEWGSNFTFGVNFTSSEDNGVTWKAITDPKYVNWEITDTLGDETFDSGEMNRDISRGIGCYNKTINSTSLIGGVSYYFVINGEKTGFSKPNPVQILFTVSGKSTSLGVYDTGSLTYLGLNITKYYGEKADLTVQYFSYGNVLFGATVSYEWQFLDTPVTLSESSGKYSFTIDTANADVGQYRITIDASLENYTTVENFIFYMNIIHRPTALNGDTTLHHITKSLWVQDPHNFTFQYQDTLSDPVINLTDVDDAYYQWYKLDADGNIIGAISNSTNLIEGVNETYILDFNTSLRAIGEYALYVTMQKNNYEVRTAFIDLTIKTRVFSATLQPDKFTDNIISVYSGDPFIFNISLHDETRNIPLTGATVQLEFQNTSYRFNETGSGGYSFNITDYNKLLATDDFNISATDIIISKTNFVTHTINITVILNNRLLNASLSEEFVGQLLTIVSGDSLSFEIDILDSSTASGLLDATITIRIGGEIYEDVTIVDNGDGTYTITLKSYPDAFFSAQTLTGEIIIEQENFRTETISFTVKIEMTEIFPGVPMFYFLMIVGSVVAIVGSLVAYRVIQQRRIPTFVKKTRTMKKNIKGKKIILDSLLYPSKEQFIAKKFGDKWEKLGLSLKEILGIKGKLKKEKLPEDKIKKGKADKKKLEKEKLKHDKLEKKKLEREKQEKEKLEKEKLKGEKLEKERLEKERLEEQKLEKEKLEKEKLEEKEIPKEKGEDE